MRYLVTKDNPHLRCIEWQEFAELDRAKDKYNKLSELGFIVAFHAVSELGYCVTYNPNIAITHGISLVPCRDCVV